MKAKLYAILSLFTLIAIFCIQTCFVKTFAINNNTLIVAKGSTPSALIKQNQDFNFFEKTTLKLFSRIYFQNKIFNFGEYKINDNSSFYKIISKIAKGDRYYRKVVLIDGETSFAFLQAINNAEGLEGNITESMPEGYLMPDTYYYLYGESKNSIIIRAKKAMSNFLEMQIMSNPNFYNDYLKTPHQILIMSSIIQAEAANEDEKPIIASVFKNRIKQNMRLQTDPTVIYEITKGKYKLERRLTLQDLSTKGDYNTYQREGLPISPINNPSKSSIAAALNPADTGYLYFVLKPSLGKHVFSNSYRTHVQNAEEYRKS